MPVFQYIMGGREREKDSRRGEVASTVGVNKKFTFRLKKTIVLRWDGGEKNDLRTLMTHPPEVRYARATLRVNVQRACKRTV